MSGVWKSLQSPYWLWALLAVPLAWLTVQYADEAIYYGEYLHLTGRISVWLLMLTLAVTPLRLTWPGSGAARWLVRSRRYFGVAAFGYAVPHLLAYLLKKEMLSYVLEEAAGADLWTGWLAVAIFALLAVTSNNVSVRRLGRSWRNLHRLVYPAAILTCAHWILTAFDPITAYAHAAVLAMLELYRVALTWRRRKNGKETRHES